MRDVFGVIEKAGLATCVLLVVHVFVCRSQGGVSTILASVCPRFIVCLYEQSPLLDLRSSSPEGFCVVWSHAIRVGSGLLKMDG